MIFRPSAKRPVAYLKSTLVRRISFNEAVLAQSMYCFCTPFVNNKIYSMEFNPFKTETQEMNDNFNSNESCQESEIIEETIILPELNVENFNPFNKQTSFIPSFATKGTSYDSEEKQILAVENFSERDSTSKSTPNHYIRPDVMNKNIFRAIRRQCRDIFENFLSEKSLSNSKVKGVFLENLMLFSDHLLNETDINIINIDGFSKSDFIKYLGLFINYCIMKKELMMTKDFKMAIETNDLLYSYSHKKFKDYLSIPEVNAIVKIIFERTDEDDFVNSQEALSSDPRAYKSQIQRIKENILAD